MLDRTKGDQIHWWLGWRTHRLPSQGAQARCQPQDSIHVLVNLRGATDNADESSGTPVVVPPATAQKRRPAAPCLPAVFLSISWMLRQGDPPNRVGSIPRCLTFNGLREPVPSSSPLSYPRRSALRPLARRVAVRRSPRTFRVRSAIESLPLARSVLFASLSVPAAGSHHPVARRALLRRRQRFVRIPAHRLPQPALAEVSPFNVRAIENRTRCGHLSRYRTSPDKARVAPASS